MDEPMYEAATGHLPPSVAVIVVDTKGFSEHNDAQQDELAILVPDLLERACRRSGLVDLWLRRVFFDGTGDGCMVGFDPAYLPAVVDRYLDALQAELRGSAPGLRARGMRLRMRLSLNVGPARDISSLSLDSPVGQTVVDACRLVDSSPVRALLDRSDPEVTFLAGVLSERIMQDVVLAGHTQRRRSEFVAVPVRIDSKGFQAGAYLRVPVLSGDLLSLGLLGVQPADGIAVDEVRESEQAPVKQGENRVDSRGRGRAWQLGTVTGRVKDASINTGAIDGPVGVIGTVRGDHNAIAGRDLDQSTRTTTVHGSQYTTSGLGGQGARPADARPDPIPDSDGGDGGDPEPWR